MDTFTLFIVACFAVGAVLALIATKDIIMADKKYHDEFKHGYWFDSNTYKTNVLNEVDTITGEPLPQSNTTSTSTSTKI